MAGIMIDREQAIEAVQNAINESSRPRGDAEKFAEAILAVPDPVHEAARERITQLEEVLAFYADPETYFGWGCFPDPPCGDWDSDFEKVEGFGATKPGKRARAALSAERVPTHVDRVTCNPMTGEPGKLLGRYPSLDDPRIGAQERDGWATYVYVSEPHTMAECPFPAERVPTPITDVERLTVAGDRLLDVVREYAPSPATTGAAIRAWMDAKAALNGDKR